MMLPNKMSKTSHDHWNDDRTNDVFVDLIGKWWCVATRERGNTYTVQSRHRTENKAVAVANALVGNI